MLKCFAGLIAVFGLLMLDVTVFFALEPYCGPRLVGGICQPVRFFRRRLPCGRATTRPIPAKLTCPGGAPGALEGFESMLVSFKTIFRHSAANCGALRAQWQISPSIRG